MQRTLLFCFLLLIGFNGRSQVLSLVPHPLQNYQHPFNEKFIQRNDIQSIQVEISEKKEMDIIRPAYKFLLFEFNDKGSLQSEKEFRIGESDTLNFSFEYDEEGRLIQEQEFIGNGILQKRYAYDDKGQKKRVEYSKKDAFEAQQNILSIDSVRGLWIDDMYVETYYNDYGRAYREVRLYYDSLEYLVKFRETFILSHKQNTIEYSYNDFGLLSEIKYFNAFTGKSRREEYIYNEEGVPDSFMIYENDYLKKRKEYLYNPDGSLKAILFKEIESNLITIWQLTYNKAS